MAKTQVVKSQFDIQDDHLMMVMDNMIQSLGADSTLPHSNTIKVVGNGLGDALQTLVQQVPVLNMKVYKVNPINTNVDVDVHIVYFLFHFLANDRRMNSKKRVNK